MKSAAKKDYQKLKVLLDEVEEFPIEYIHKIIGRNSELFLQSVSLFEKQFPHLRRKGERKSENQAHLALTYVFIAQSSDEVISVFKATEQIDDLLIVL